MGDTSTPKRDLEANDGIAKPTPVRESWEGDTSFIFMGTCYVLLAIGAVGFSTSLLFVIILMIVPFALAIGLGISGLRHASRESRCRERAALSLALMLPLLVGLAYILANANYPIIFKYWRILFTTGRAPW